METLRLNALAIHLGVDVQELEICSYNDQIVEYGDEEYLVVTDSEADDLWEQELDNYIDDCIIDSLPENLQNYFDREAWKSDARHDGRAHSLDRYDGNEDEVTVYYNEDENLFSDDTIAQNEEGEDCILDENETFYIYRQN